MELERTHTQLRDPNTPEHVINNYDNNARDNKNDNLKREELYCRIGNFPARIIVKTKKNISWNSEKMFCCQNREKKDSRD